ncbi:vomeronasal type-1 receptor 90-like [Sciurus carolinensis]|uniref:vomeronasal type-1 receptor 90-like n=1 Tax=Sciurus carolinensis TaxID=30640 RepID=UPI001FB47342|nr:vomeronasal type-1 receptor 90-like [Sciurus carolinensis]
MFPSDTIFGVFLISQFCIGVPGNSLLFMLYAYTFLVKSHLKKHIDPIVMNLLFTNALTIMFTLIPEIASTMGVRRCLDDVDCQTVLISYRLTRGVSICTTSLLSAFQAITVSPVHSKATRNHPLVGHDYIHAYCQSIQFSTKYAGSFLGIILIHGLVFVLLMVCTSLYMVSLLYRHRRRAQHIHSPHVSSQSSPELRATRTILLLVSVFVFFYLANNCFTFYSFYVPKKTPRLEGISLALSSCFPTICPYLLMKNNKIISQFNPFQILGLSFQSNLPV